VDYVVEFTDDTPLALIEALHPDVLIKGGDYSTGNVVGADIVIARGGRVVTPVFVPGASTTNIAETIVSSRAERTAGE
jgi:bifunctional ADP-heptose synthase (sugar kinase/adenylyltransferase)